MSDSLGSRGLSDASSSVHGNLQAREFWNELPFSSPGDLHDPGIEPGSLALQANSLATEPPGKIETCKWLSVSHSVMPDCLQPHGLQPTSLCCPWDFPGKNTGMSCHCLLLGIFPTQGLNPHLWWQVNSLPLSHHGCPPSPHTPQQSLFSQPSLRTLTQIEIKSDHVFLPSAPPSPAKTSLNEIQRPCWVLQDLLLSDARFPLQLHLQPHLSLAHSHQSPCSWKVWSQFLHHALCINCPLRNMFCHKYTQIPPPLHLIVSP